MAAPLLGLIVEDEPSEFYVPPLVLKARHLSGLTFCTCIIVYVHVGVPEEYTQIVKL